MYQSVSEIIKKSQAIIDNELLLNGKRAAYEQIEGVTSMPGAENDGKADADAVAAKANAELKNRATPEPDGSRTSEGAGEPDDANSRKNRTLDMTDPAPIKDDVNPLDTANFNADRPGEKTAALSNDILTMIRQYQKSANEAQGKQANEAQDKQTNAAQDKQANEETNVDKINLSPAVLSKIASALATASKGYAVTGKLEKEAEDAYKTGVYDAETLIDAFLTTTINKSAQEAVDEAIEEELPEEPVTPEDVGQVLGEMVDSGEIDPDTAIQIAQEVDAAAGDGEGAAEPAPEEQAALAGDVIPADTGAMADVAEKEASYYAGVSDAIKLAQEAVDEAIEEELPEEPVTPEDVGQVLGEMVESGEIDPDTAIQIAQEVDTAAGEGAAEPAPEEVAETTEKEASYYAGVNDAIKLAQEAVEETIEEELPEEPVTPEDVGQVLGEMVDSGEIDPDTAIQIAQEVDAAAGEGVAEPAPEEVAEAAEKEASYYAGIADALRR